MMESEEEEADEGGISIRETQYWMSYRGRHSDEKRAKRLSIS